MGHISFYERKFANLLKLSLSNLHRFSIYVQKNYQDICVPQIIYTFIIYSKIKIHSYVSISSNKFINMIQTNIHYIFFIIPIIPIYC